jgi:hypothetical protein
LLRHSAYTHSWNATMDPASTIALPAAGQQSSDLSAGFFQQLRLLRFPCGTVVSWSSWGGNSLTASARRLRCGIPRIII